MSLSITSRRHPIIAQAQEVLQIHHSSELEDQLLRRHRKRRLQSQYQRDRRRQWQTQWSRSAGKHNQLLRLSCSALRPKLAPSPRARLLRLQPPRLSLLRSYTPQMNQTSTLMAKLPPHLRRRHSAHLLRYIISKPRTNLMTPKASQMTMVA